MLKDFEAGQPERLQRLLQTQGLGLEAVCLTKQIN